MKNFAAFFLFLVLAALTASARPVVNSGGVVNGASFTPTALPRSGIAQGSIMAIFGTDLGPAGIVHATSFPLPTELAGTSVQVTSGGATLDAIILYTTARQVGAILPSGTPPGIGSLTVTYNGETSNPVSFQIVPSSFGLFTANSRGSGPAVAHYPGLRDQVVYNTLVTPAFPDELLTLWGTGLGPISGEDNQPPQAGNLSADVQVFVGGLPAEILYAGRSPCCAGVDQINIVVPGVEDNCYVPVVVEVNGAPSNFATLAVSDDIADTPSLTLPCSDPNGFTTSELEMIQAGGCFNVGTISLTRWEGEPDYSSALFGRWDATKLLQGAFNFGAIAAGHCAVGDYFFSTGQPLSFPLTELLDAGSSLNLSGPNGMRQLASDVGFYQYDVFLDASYFSPGSYTLPVQAAQVLVPFKQPSTFPLRLSIGLTKFLSRRSHGPRTC